MIRRELGEAVILTTGDTVTLGAEVACDVDALLAAAAAGDVRAVATRYRGPLLDAWFVREAPEFEQWADAERARLAGVVSIAFEAEAARCESNGDWAAAASWWQQLGQTNAYNTTPVLRAATALARSGEPALAIQALTAHAEKLRTELEVEPDAQLTALMQHIRQGAIPASRAEPSASASVWAPESVSTIASAAATPNRDAPRRTAPTGAPQPPARPRRWPTAVGSLLVLTLLAAGTTWARARSASGSGDITSARTTDNARDARDRGRMAVLYFDDASPEKDLAYLADGLTEHLISVLARTPGLRVTSAENVQRLRQVPLDSIARTLRVRTLLTAQVERSAGKVRVSARLIDTRTMEAVGSLVAESKENEPLALQDALSARVAVELVRWVGRAVRIGEATDAARLGGRSNEALGLVLRAERLRKEAEQVRVTGGRDSASTETARAMLRRADAMLAQSEALDESWPTPALERGWVSMNSGMLENGVPRVLTLGQGIAHAERSTTLIRSAPRPDSVALAHALYLRGLLRVRSAIAIQTFRPESSTIRAGEADLERAVSLDESLAGAWVALALPRYLRGDFAGVELAAGRALAADVYAEDVASTIGWAWRAAAARGDAAEATRWCDRGHRELPEDWHFVECSLTIMRLDVSGLSGRTPDSARAWALVRQLDRLDPPERARTAGRAYSPTFRRLVAAMVTSAAGDTARAMQVLAQAQADARGSTELTTDLLYETACLYFVLGKREAGEQALSDYLRARPDLAGFIARDAAVRRLRGRT